MGHVISAEGVATDPSKVAEVVDWPIPTTSKQLRGFSGLCGYYRRFVGNFGTIARPLHDVLKKDNFCWIDKQTSAFQQLKQAMTNVPVLALPNFTEPFVLETDASGTGIGAVMMQQGKPIAYYSSSLCPKNAALSTYEKEALAILDALKKWRHYFLATALIIRTDQESLKYIQEQKITEGIQHKLLLKLLGYNFTVEYKKGKENRVADALSRVKHMISSPSTSFSTPKWISEVVKSYNSCIPKQQNGSIRLSVATSYE